MDFKQIGLGVALTAMAFSVAATPQNLDTMAEDSSLDRQAGLNQGPGYYIWNSSNSPSDWRVRWNADDQSAPDIVEWFGSLTFQNATLDTDSVQEISFESGQYADDLGLIESSNSGLQMLDWFAYTNNEGGYDGFNFTLDSDSELLKFSLGSSLFGTDDDAFYELIRNDSDSNATAAEGVFVGEDYDAPQVLVSNRDGRTYQDFEVLVPEPGTLALLGLGLLGLGAARRRQS